MLPEADLLKTAAADVSQPSLAVEPLRMPMALLLLAKPGIVIAEMLAGVAGALLAVPAPSPAGLCLMLLLLAMAAVGAAMANCLMEEKTDKQMQRLSRRCHALESAGRRRVLLMAAILTLSAPLLAAACFNALTLLLLLLASGIYIVIYTGWLKRRTPWSVLAGGIPGALPPLIGAAAVSGSLPVAALFLAGMIYLWQLPHFCFLALHCSGQYRLAGIPVLPLSHGERTTRAFALLAILALLTCTLAFSAFAVHGTLMTLLLLTLSLAFVLFSYDCLYRTKEHHTGFVGSLAYMAVLLVSVIFGAISGTIG